MRHVVACFADRLPDVGTDFPVGNATDDNGVIHGTVVASQWVRDREARVELEIAAEDWRRLELTS